MADLRKAILNSTLKAFREKGLKFTMDDIARYTGISKKTIYTVFSDKEALFLAMVDYLFDGIKKEEQRLLESTDLNTVEKIRRILGVMPAGYREIDFGQLYVLREKYPKIYKQVESRLENGWEGTISLLQKGMEEGIIRRIQIPILKLMLESTLEQFFSRDILKRNGITYTDALDEVVRIMLDGIVMTKDEKNKE